MHIIFHMPLASVVSTAPLARRHLGVGLPYARQSLICRAPRLAFSPYDHRLLQEENKQLCVSSVLLRWALLVVAVLARHQHKGV